MKNIEYNFNINKKKVYSAEEIIKDFPNYFGVDFTKMKEYYKNYKTISKEELVGYIKNNFGKMAESRTASVQEIIEKRGLDYDYFQQVLLILSENARLYLNLLEYMASLGDIREQREDIEEVIEDLNIYHLGKAVTGESVYTIFLNLAHLFNYFQKTHNRTNTLEDYHIQTVDSFMIHYMGERRYPVRLVSEKQNEQLEKTLLGYTKTKKRSS